MKPSAVCVGALVCLASCASKPKPIEVSPVFAEHAPQSIEVRVSRDGDVDAEASDVVRAEVESRLRRRGYAIESVADARLELTIREYGRRVSIAHGASSPVVELEAWLYDCATSTILWRGQVREDDIDEDEQSDNDWALAFVDWTIDSVASLFTDDVAATAEDAVISLLRDLPSRQPIGPL